MIGRSGLCVLLLISGAAVCLPVTVGVASGGAHVEEEPRAEFSVLVPNPTAQGDAGELIVIEFSKSTNVSGWTIRDDGTQHAQLPDRTLTGTVAFSRSPETAQQHTDHKVHPLSGWLQLANSEETLTLQTADGTTVGTVTYTSAPEGKQYVRRGEGWHWQTPGTTDFSFPSVRPQSATAFVLPDSPAVIEQHLAAADRRILIGGYTFASNRTVETLLAAHQRGVTVSVLLEREPVGGITTQQVTALNKLADAGITVRLSGGANDRYRFHHPKYAVIDDQALVMTENWKPSGTGGHGNRGWGTIIQDRTLAEQLTRVHRADRTAHDAQSWQTTRAGVSPTPGKQATGTYPTQFHPTEVPVTSAELLVTPDNAAQEITQRLSAADSSIRIIQVNIDTLNFELLEATLDAARRGVSVEILLSGAWYTSSDNKQFVKKLQATVDEEDLPVQLKTAQAVGQFHGIHAKGIVIDKEQVILGSINWNSVSLHENREVAVVMEGKAVAQYYVDVFEADQRGGRWSMPIGFLGAAVLVWMIVGWLLGRRLRWSQYRKTADETQTHWR